MANTLSSLPAGHRSRDHGGPLDGIWDNQLGSELVLEDDGEGGLTGTYRRADGLNPDSTYLVRGSYDVMTKGPCRVLGFVVNWSEHQTITVWSGRFNPDDQTIGATWLMTTESDEADEWRSTFVGHDMFRRRPPTSGAAGSGA